METDIDFFIPEIPPEKQEEAYAQLAAFCSTSPHPKDGRYYSIKFKKGASEEWTATVGKQLVGTKRVTKNKNNKKVEIIEQLTDPCIVMAIFKSQICFMVATKSGGSPSSSRAFNNPFMAGQPISISLFKKPCV